MSIKQMSKVWEHEWGGPAQRVMLALADFADDDGGNIFPSMARLAWKTEFSERQVQRIIKSLRKKKVLKLVHRATFIRAAEYSINWKAAKYKLSFVEWKTRGDILTPPKVRGDILTPVGVTSEVERGDIAVSPDPSLDPSVDPSIPVLSSTRGIQKAYEGCVPYKIDWIRGEGHAAKWLAENGYTPDDITACYADLKAQKFWSDKPLSLSSIKKQIGEWKVRKTSKGKVIKLVNVVTA